MAGAKNHDYHILPPDIWPIFGAFSAFLMAIGGIRWMHDDIYQFGPLMFA
ncbi:MAG: cytochrome c oxidase subunit 3, partial [Pseudomonadota bacterium]